MRGTTDLRKMKEQVTTVGVNALPSVNVNKRINDLKVGQAVLIEDLSGCFCSAYLVRRKSKRVFEMLALWGQDTPQGRVLTNSIGEGLVYIATSLKDVALRSYWVAMKKCHAEEIKEYYMDRYPKAFVQWLEYESPHLVFDKETNAIMEAEYNKIQRDMRLEDMTFSELYAFGLSKDNGMLADRHKGALPKALEEAFVTVYS